MHSCASPVVPVRHERVRSCCESASRSLRRPAAGFVRQNGMVNSSAGRLFASAVLMAIACVVPFSPGAAAQYTGVTWLIFVDDLHLDFRNTGYIRKLLGSIASELIREGDALVLRSSGPSSVSIPFTTDRSLLNLAIGRVAGGGMHPDEILRLSPATEPQDEVRYRASLAASAATEMLDAGPSSSGRRTVMLYVSNGYHVDTRDARIAGFSSTAQRSHVTVFAMNPRGLPGAPALLVKGDAALWASYRAAMLSSLRAMSEPTGGFAVLDEADFAEALQRISRRVR